MRQKHAMLVLRPPIPIPVRWAAKGKTTTVLNSGGKFIPSWLAGQIVSVAGSIEQEVTILKGTSAYRFGHRTIQEFPKTPVS